LVKKSRIRSAEIHLQLSSDGFLDVGGQREKDGVEDRGVMEKKELPNAMDPSDLKE
jgi:hypothetical protein